MRCSSLEMTIINFQAQINPKTNKNIGHYELNVICFMETINYSFPAASGGFCELQIHTLSNPR
jgi:hypothetical protein